LIPCQSLSYFIFILVILSAKKRYLQLLQFLLVQVPQPPEEDGLI